MAVDLDREGEVAAQPRAPTVRAIATSISWAAAGNVAVQLASYSSILVLAALLPPSAFGTVAAAAAIIGVATLVMEAGTSGSIIATRDLTREHVRGALVLNVGVGIVLAAAIVVSANPIAKTFAGGGDASAVQVLGLMLVTVSLAIVPSALLKKAMYFKRDAAVRVSSTVIGAAAAIAAAVAGAGIWALVTRHVLGSAVATVLSWILARDVFPRPQPNSGSAEGRRSRLRRPENSLWFFVMALSTLLAFSGDNLVVGAATDATQLGFYALAFNLAFVPLTQFSWQVGGVLFPATAATDDLETVARRTVTAARFVALILFPLLPPALVLAPVVLPAVLGPEWREMVPLFQILLVVAACHAVTSMIGESLSGTGNVPFRAPIDAAWAVGTIAAIFVLVQIAGVRGAAWGHLALFVPLALAYGTAGMRRIGGDAKRLWGALRGIVAAVAAQALVTFGLVVALEHADLDSALAAGAAAVVSFAFVIVALTLVPSKPLGDARRVVSTALRKERAT